MSLSLYKKKRKFDKTPEPGGKVDASRKMRFVIQRHEASRLHYDFRLELGGVLKSWAVPKGPSINPKDRRLAVMVEDHPVDYIDFKGTIPEGNYGAGKVMIWDNGSFYPVDKDHKKISEKQALKNLSGGELKFYLKGKKVKGEFVLVRLKDEKNWLLIKHRDEFSTEKPYDAESFIKAAKVKNPETEKKHSPVKRKSGSKRELKLSNPDKIYWPGEKITKGQMLDYYDKIAPVLLPYLKDRPLSLKRNPDGIRGKSFYHKDAGDIAPEWMRTFDIYSPSSHKTVHYLVCDNREGILFAANLGSIEMNPWNSTTTNPDHPDYLVIDLDPSDKNSFEDVIETAKCVKEICDEVKLPAFCKTSGASGLHVYIPLKAKYDYDTARDFAEMLAMKVVERLPELTTMERSLARRSKSKIYVDYLQNSKGQTLASAYSVRPKPGATVSAPLDWKEVKKGLDPKRFTIFTMPQRVKRKGDLFAGIFKKGADLSRSLKLLDKIS